MAAGPWCSVYLFAWWWESLQLIRVLDTSLSAGGDGGTVLVRMGNPAVYGALGPTGCGHPEVHQQRIIEAVASATGLPLGVDTELHDFTLLTDEAALISAEREGLGDKLTEWPIFGVSAKVFDDACKESGASDGDSCPRSLQPGQVPDKTRRRLAASFPEWDKDHLSDRVETLHEALHARRPDASRWRVLFFHCVCGCDRTGEMAMAYSMRYLNTSFTQAMTENRDLIGRDMIYGNQVAVQWYCDHLRSAGLYRGDDCGTCGPFRCSDSGWRGIFIRKFGLLAMACVLTGVACLWACRKARARANAEPGPGYQLLR